MSQLIQCVPNFSEGRRPEVIEAIVAAIAAAGVKLLGVAPDKDHNRTVVTFVGNAEQVANAAFNGAKVAAQLIDLNQHQGDHPRMGATDVIPFIPIKDVTMEACVELANQVGERLANELKIPVYLYEAAARRPERKNLAAVRRGQFEGLREAVKTDPDKRPDFGPAELHPTAGITAVGARLPLIAFNVNLGTNDLKIARRIARAVRGSSGGLVGVKALGVELKERNQVQVSMNLVNFQETPIHRAFELVRLEAERYGVPVVGSEIIGAVPTAALVGVAQHYLRLEGFRIDQVLEQQL